MAKDEHTCFQCGRRGHKQENCPDRNAYRDLLKSNAVAAKALETKTRGPWKKERKTGHDSAPHAADVDDPAPRGTHVGWSPPRGSHVTRSAPPSVRASHSAPRTVYTDTTVPESAHVDLPDTLPPFGEDELLSEDGSFDFVDTEPGDDITMSVAL
ncbi:uncharacterized protein LDX57_009624 [Aspergillus melleus]|uniref:uncharacterized protein n=1 Tax=Aspergillus melleus TaxID=138277 RepID=UPI001E8DF9CC|nr:uncharacterized protein LDX57_009624 [Aspergillus melleus]KAH8431977.1 hypothetical protein LDX57_009624 [Aspergillus melleus]